MKYDMNKKLSVAYHTLDSGYNVYKSFLELKRHVVDRKLWEVCESLQIFKSDNLMKNDRCQ